MLARTLTLVMVGFGLFTIGCDNSGQQPGGASSAAPRGSTSVAKPTATMPPAPPIAAPPDPLPDVKAPPENPMTPEKVNLGKQLFFDKRLSKDGSASCETCHVPEKGWTDGQALSTKVGGAKNTRHSPTLFNV